MFRTIVGSDQVNSGKNTEINKQLHVKFWFNRKKYGGHILGVLFNIRWHDFTPFLVNMYMFLHRTLWSVNQRPWLIINFVCLFVCFCGHIIWRMNECVSRRKVDKRQFAKPIDGLGNLNSKQIKFPTSMMV